MNLTERAILVDLSVSRWSGRKFDPQVTNEVDRNHDARDSGRFNKKVLDTPAYRSLIQKANALYAYHTDNTLLWLNKGPRVLPTAKFMDYKETIADLIDEYNRSADDFVYNQYEKGKSEARSRLGDLYNENDYPPREILRRKFRAVISFLPFPDTSDFRIKLGEEEVNFIKESTLQTIKDKMNDGIIDLLGRVRKYVERMEYNLSAGKIFRDSMISNIEDSITNLRTFNITDDVRLVTAAAALGKLVADPQTLRDDKNYRDAYARHAKDVLKTLDRLITGVGQTSLFPAFV